MFVIRNINLVLQASILFNGVIFIENGIISEIGRAVKTKIPENCEIIDGRDLYLGPGLVDIHTHSGGGIWFHENPLEASQAILHLGTTSVLPALYFNLDKAEYIQAIKTIRNASKSGAGKIIRGIYMEGPYLNPKFGCEADNNKWKHGVVESEFKSIIDEVSDFAKIFCVAPELNQINQFVQYVKAKVPGAIFSVAHSEAAPDQVLALVPHGLRLATHHTNATGDRIFYPEVRGVCVDEAVNYHRDIYAELICDEMGIHVDPFMLKLVRRIKGDDRIILISDAFVSDGPIPDGYEGVTDINFDDAGEIAGSKMVLSKACKNMMSHTGAGLCDIFNFASYNPAKLINLERRGEIKVGNIADLVMVDHKMTVKKVFLAGEQIVHEKNLPIRDAAK